MAGDKPTRNFLARMDSYLIYTGETKYQHSTNPYREDHVPEGPPPRDYRFYFSIKNQASGNIAECAWDNDVNVAAKDVRYTKKDQLTNDMWLPFVSNFERSLSEFEGIRCTIRGKIDYESTNREINERMSGGGSSRDKNQTWILLSLAITFKDGGLAYPSLHFRTDQALSEFVIDDIGTVNVVRTSGQ